MQNFIIFICLIVTVYFSLPFTTKMATTGSKVEKHEKKETSFPTNTFNLSEI